MDSIEEQAFLESYDLECASRFRTIKANQADSLKSVYRFFTSYLNGLAPSIAQLEYGEFLDKYSADMGRAVVEVAEQELLEKEKEGVGMGMIEQSARKRKHALTSPTNRTTSNSLDPLEEDDVFSQNTTTSKRMRAASAAPTSTTKSKKSASAIRRTKATSVDPTPVNFIYQSESTSFNPALPPTPSLASSSQLPLLPLGATARKARRGESIVRRIVTLSLNGSPVALSNGGASDEEGDAEVEEGWDMMDAHEASKIDAGNDVLPPGGKKGRLGKSAKASAPIPPAPLPAAPPRRSSRSRSSSLVPNAVPSTSTSKVPTSSSFNYVPPSSAPSYGGAGESMESKEARYKEMTEKVEQLLHLSEEQRETWFKIARETVFGVV